MDEALTTGGIDLTIKRFREWKADPINKYADTGIALLEAGQRLLNEKKPADALELFKLELAENPHSWRAHFATGVAYKEIGKTDLAITHFEESSRDKSEELRCCELLEGSRQVSLSVSHLTI